MSYSFVKEKAVVLSFIIICSIFSIYLINPVSAVEPLVCCQETKSGEFCSYTLEENCAAGVLKSPSSCEQTNFCEVGCCVSQQGICSKNVGKARCEALAGYKWSSQADCNIEQCRKGWFTMCFDF
jgi:hypothetical protein